MAIINSVVMGAARNKVGEVTSATLHGRTVVRKYQATVSNPRTLGQVSQRNRIANIVLLFRALINVVNVGFPTRKNYQSPYNAFTKRNVSLMPFDQVYPTLTAFIAALVNAGNMLVVSFGTLIMGAITYTSGTGVFSFTFNPAELRVVPGDMLHAYGMTAGGDVDHFTQVIDAAEIGVGSATISGTAGRVYVISGGFVRKRNGRDASTSVATFA